MKKIPLHIFNSLAKPYLEALDDMMDEEEGELEEDDDEEKEQGEEDQEEQAEGQEEHDNDDEDLYRKLIEDEFSDSDVE